MQLSEDFQPLVYSNHHQALEKIGKDLVPGATSQDGKIIESVHHLKYSNVLAVQFHPENYLLYTEEEKNYRQVLDDSISVSGREILAKDGSLDFHIAFWNYFSGLFE